MNCCAERFGENAGCACIIMGCGTCEDKRNLRASAFESPGGRSWCCSCAIVPASVEKCPIRGTLYPEDSSACDGKNEKEGPWKFMPASCNAGQDGPQFAALFAATGASGDGSMSTSEQKNNASFRTACGL